MSFWIVLTVFVIFATSLKAEKCVTPLGQNSQCVPITQCQEMLNGARRGVGAQTVDYVRQSACGCDGKISRVCCGPLPSNFLDERLIHDIDANSLEDSRLSSQSECGKEYLGDSGDKIFGGTRTDIGEFPWLALLWYIKHGGREPEHKCGGMLINRRYVLTAAHCISGKIRDYGRLVSVSLGEHDIRNVTDCIDGFCSDPPQNIPVLSSYPHSQFADENFNKQDDIGLIRLAKRVRYSDFVQPICLDNTGMWNIGDEVHVAGWGKTLHGPESPEKLKVSLSIANQAKCTQLFRSHHRLTLTSTQLCVGGKFLKDACHGDSGGPAMRNKGGTWEAIALVSFGYGCGRDEWPAVYTIISSYHGWILSVLSSTNVVCS